ncbi:hypothetical protein B0H19DRAFT_1066851 [Mycena capillaripes]|nr:hypothetical protein B0H19DRAFT_1066851 [Mycena capillaripes]
MVVNPLSQRSLVALDWILLTSGIPAPQSLVSLVTVLTLPSGNGVCSMNIKLSVTASLAYGLVLGHNWRFFCCETLPDASVHLSSGIFALISGQQMLDLSPEESDVDFGRGLLAFLDDTISNQVPEDSDPDLFVPSNSHHPCSVRGMPVDEGSFTPQRQKDLRNAASQCQTHTYSKTCFKYWRGPPEPKICRFDLHDNNFRAESSFGPGTGEILLTKIM